MSISYEGIGAWCATFAAGTGPRRARSSGIRQRHGEQSAPRTDGFCGVVAMGRDGKGVQRCSSAAPARTSTAARPRRRSAGICSRRTETAA